LLCREYFRTGTPDIMIKRLTANGVSLDSMKATIRKI
jgi:hypothetical protein